MTLAEDSDSQALRSDLVNETETTANAKGSRGRPDRMRDISQYFNILSDARIRELKVLLAKSLFSGHISFNFVKNKYF